MEERLWARNRMISTSKYNWDSFFKIPLRFKYLTVLIFFFAAEKKVAVRGALDAGLQQRQKMLENQIQAADQDLKSMANKLMRAGVFQVENAANQLQIAKSMQTVAANVLTTNGLNDVSRLLLALFCKWHANRIEIRW